MDDSPKQASGERRGARIATALFAALAVWFILSTVYQISRYALSHP